MTPLRAMRWQDLPEVHRLEERAFPQDPWSLASLWAELAARPRRDYVVLEDDDRGTLLGYAGLDVAGDSADIMTIAVDPSRRGEGHGTTLLQTLVERARGTGAEQVVLEVRADNPEAIGLYRRHGFTELRRRRGYYQPGAVDALVMRREVGSGV